MLLFDEKKPIINEIKLTKVNLSKSSVEKNVEKV
jgi:hypothetical protein